jgi:hypothetical protein
MGAENKPRVVSIHYINHMKNYVAQGQGLVIMPDMLDAIVNGLDERLKMIAALRQVFDDTGVCALCCCHHHEGQTTYCPIMEVR